MIDGGAGRPVRDSTGEGQGLAGRDRSGVRGLPGDSSRSPMDRDDPLEGGEYQGSTGGPSGSVAVEPTARTSPALDRAIPGDPGVDGPPTTDGESPREDVPPPGDQERWSGVVPAGGESDPTLALQQLPGAIRRLQDRADALEQVVNRALNQVILSQGMMARQLGASTRVAANRSRPRSKPASTSIQRARPH